MTKIKYIDFIRNSLQMIDQTNKYHREQVAAALNIAINTAFWELWGKPDPKLKKSFERYTTLVTSTPTLSVTTGRYESALTVDIVDLPRKAGGIFEIITKSTSTITKFIPVSSIEGAHLYGSEGSLPGNVVGYALTGPRTVEYWDMSAAEAAAGVAIRLVKQFRDYVRTDNVVLPYGQDQRIIELTRQYLGAIPPKDLINDNADIRIKQDG